MKTPTTFDILNAEAAKEAADRAAPFFGVLLKIAREDNVPILVAPVIAALTTVASIAYYTPCRDVDAPTAEEEFRELANRLAARYFSARSGQTQIDTAEANALRHHFLIVAEELRRVMEKDQ